MATVSEALDACTLLAPRPADAKRSARLSPVTVFERNHVLRPTATSARPSHAPAWEPLDPPAAGVSGVASTSTLSSAPPPEVKETLQPAAETNIWA